MAYNPTSKKLTRQKANRKSAIQRSSKSYWDLATAGSGAYAVADTASAISTLTSSMLKVESAITPTKQAYEELNIGRKAVGLEEQKYSMWDMFGKGPDVTDKETSWKDMEPAEADATSVQQTGHQYNVGELKNIGREVMSGTAKGTLDGSTWQDVTGKSLGTRPKPRDEQFGEAPVTQPKESSVQDMSKSPDKSLLDAVGSNLQSNVSQDTPDPNAAVAAPDLSSATENVISDESSTLYEDRTRLKLPDFTPSMTEAEVEQGISKGFNDAFGRARKAGVEKFMWADKEYTTNLK